MTGPSLVGGSSRTVEFMDSRSDVKEFLASRLVKGLRHEEVALLASVDY